MRLRWTRRAEGDLAGQCDHVARDDPALAAALLDRVLTAVEGLAEFPFRGRPGRVEGTRELVLPGLPWLAVYAVEGTDVLVLRFLHGAQDWPPHART